MMWLYVILVIVFLSFCNCKNMPMTCPGTKALHFDEICVGSNVCSTKATNFKWINLNSKTGKVTLEFSTFLHFCDGTHNLILEVSEMTTEAECESTNEDCDKGGFEYHSERTVRTKQKNCEGESCPSCEKKVNVTFNLIYRSCYRLKIKSKNVISCSPSTFLATNFTKKDLFGNMKLNVNSWYDKLQKHMVHTVSNVNELHVSKMKLQVRACNPCNSCRLADVLQSFVLTLNVDGDYICERGEETSKCTSVGGYEIRCITEISSNQSQCLWVELFGHPCGGKGVWKNTAINNYNKGCQWNSQLVLPQVLLLYPHDCEPFLNLMKTFRNILKEIMKCKVYDCFDPDLAEEVGSGGVEWLNNLISCDNIKIVMIESECAVFHQKALYQGIRICYQNPTWLDDFFLHGLKELANDKRKDQYDRVFVIRIRGFTDGNDGLGIITPNTRYVIPQHLQELISSLYGHTNNLEYINHIHALEEDIRNLEEYKKHNVDYLDHLLLQRT